MSTAELAKFVFAETVEYQRNLDAVLLVDVIDLHFVRIGFGGRADTPAKRARFVELCQTSADGEFGTRLDVARLHAGPSYIELGAWLGSQDAALRFIGLGTLYKLWSAVTPETFGFSGKDADDMAGRGFVMMAPGPNTAKELGVV